MSSKTEAKKAAKEDAMQTGPAGIPDTDPAPSKKQRLTPEESAKRAAEQLETHIDNIEYRTQLILQHLADMGVASLAGRIGNYTDVPIAIRQASIDQVQKRLDQCKAALEASKATQPKKAKLDLRAVAGVPAVGQ